MPASHFERLTSAFITQQDIDFGDEARSQVDNRQPVPVLCFSSVPNAKSDEHKRGLINLTRDLMDRTNQEA